MRIAASVILALLVATAAQIASGSTSNTRFKIFEIRLDGTSHRSLLKNPNVNDYIEDISADGKRILFERLYSEELPDDLYIADIDGRHLNVIASNLLVDGPVFSPDGRKVAFVGGSDCVPSVTCYGRQLWLVNADGTGLRMFAENAIAPRWSPDSRRLAYVGRFVPEQGKGAVTVANARGPRQAREIGPLEQTEEDDWRLRWSPRGDRIVYMVRSESGIFIRVARLDGGVRTLPAGYYPNWSPGRRLTFEDREGLVNVIAADGGHRRRLTSGRGPVWSPDGRWIAFSDRSRCTQLFVIRPNGHGRRQVTHEPCGSGFDIFWSPDSRRLIYPRRRLG